MGMKAQAKVEFGKASTLNKAEDERLLKVMSTLPASKHTTDGAKQTQK